MRQLKEKRRLDGLFNPSTCLSVQCNPLIKNVKRYGRGECPDRHLLDNHPVGRALGAKARTARPAFLPLVHYGGFCKACRNSDTSRTVTGGAELPQLLRMKLSTSAICASENFFANAGIS